MNPNNVHNLTEEALDSSSIPVNPNNVQNLTEALGSLDDNKTILSEIKHLFLAHNNVPNIFLNGLLKILNTHPCFSNFPVDSRTMFKSENPLIPPGSIIPLEPGHYCHFSIRNGISFGYKEILGKLDKIELVIGIDGYH